MRTTGLMLALLAGAAVAAPRVVGDFSAGDLDGWQTKSFEGETRYTLVRDGGRTVLRADSDGAASGLFYEQRIDLTETPYLSWSWKVANVLDGVDEHTKAGDDFAARVYVVISGTFFWQTRTLVYVWSNNQPVGTHWENPFTSNARHIAVESGTERLGRWLDEKRNVREDFKKVFGDDIDHVDAVALMTDTDNSGLSATAWYGDIWFGGE